MGKRSDTISESLQAFIARQKLFFVGTAAADGRVNISPKGMDTLRVLAPNRVVWLNVTGSGNETAAHVLELNRITLMFCAFEGDPVILRLYGQAKIIHPGDGQWSKLIGLFPALPGARQIFDVAVDLVQTSCGMAVPLMEYRDERTALNDWANKKGQAGIEQYWQEKNRQSLDGKATLMPRPVPRPKPIPSKQPGDLTFKISAILLGFSGLFELTSLTARTPLFGSLVGMPAVLLYHLLYVVLFIAVGIGMWRARSWAYSLTQFTCVVYTLDRLQVAVFPEAIREYLLSELQSAKTQLAGLPIDLSMLEQPDLINQVVWGLQLMAFTMAACMAGFAVWTYWRRAYFGIEVRSVK